MSPLTFNDAIRGRAAIARDSQLGKKRNAKLPEEFRPPDGERPTLTARAVCRYPRAVILSQKGCITTAQKPLQLIHAGC